MKQFQQFADQHGITATFDYQGVEDQRINFKVTLIRNKTPLLVTPFFVGFGHAEPWAKKHLSRFSFNTRDLLKNPPRWPRKIHPEASYWTEIGAAWGKSAEPNKLLPDVLYCLQRDSRAVDMCWPDYADEMGLNVDSIKEKQLYEDTVQIGLVLRRNLGQLWHPFQELEDA